MVDCLEDTDPHVRDCARQSTIELFSGSAVTDAARADLKKEMSKKGVRKTIVDNVLTKLLNSALGASNSQSHEGSENGDASTPKEYVPPSLMLQGRRPRLGSQNAISQGGDHAGSTSQGSTREVLSRPSSRTAMASSPPPPTNTGDSAEVQPVFVCAFNTTFLSPFLIEYRSRQAKIWKMNSCQWQKLLRSDLSFFD